MEHSEDQTTRKIQLGKGDAKGTYRLVEKSTTKPHIETKMTKSKLPKVVREPMGNHRGATISLPKIRWLQNCKKNDISKMTKNRNVKIFPSRFRLSELTYLEGERHRRVVKIV